MGTNIAIKEGFDFNEQFESLKPKPEKPISVISGKSTRVITSRLTPIQKRVLENPIFSVILDKLDILDWEILFSERKADEYESEVRLQLIHNIRKQFNVNDFGERWKLIKEQRKLAPNMLKKILYIVEVVLDFAESIGSRIVVRGGIPYMYNYEAKKYEDVDISLMSAFLEMAAERCGLDIDDARTARFRAIFNEQLHTSAAYIDEEENTDVVMINMQNGIFHFDGKKVTLLPHDKEMYFLYTLKFDYDESASCPKFQKYLNDVLELKEEHELLQEYLGYCLGGNFLKLEKALMLYGPLGSGGKSVLHDCLELMFNRVLMSNYSLSAVSDPKYLYNLQNKLINYSSEIDFSRANMEIFKQLTSCETVAVRQLYHMPKEVMLRVKQIYNANALPDTDMSEAVFRRLIILRFDRVFSESEANVNLAKELAAEENAGIFNWMVEGLKRLTERGRFDIPMSVQKNINDYKHESVNINHFLDETGWVKSNDKRDKILLGSLYKIYARFTKDYGYKSFSIRNFSNHLKKLGFEVYKSTGNRTYILCRNIPDYEEELTAKTIE